MLHSYLRKGTLATPTPQPSKTESVRGSGFLVCGLIHFMCLLPPSLDFSEHKVWRFGGQESLPRPSLGFLSIKEIGAGKILP